VLSLREEFYVVGGQNSNGMERGDQSQFRSEIWCDYYYYFFNILLLYFG